MTGIALNPTTTRVRLLLNSQLFTSSLLLYGHPCNIYIYIYTFFQMIYTQSQHQMHIHIAQVPIPLRCSYSLILTYLFSGSTSPLFVGGGTQATFNHYNQASFQNFKQKASQWGRKQRKLPRMDKSLSASTLSLMMIFSCNFALNVEVLINRTNERPDYPQE